MYNWKTACRLGYGLQVRQLKLGRRINHSALGDGLRDDRAAGSAAGSAAEKECTTRRLQIISRPADETAEARKKNELTTRTDGGQLAAAATGPVCRATRYSRQGDVLVVMLYKRGK